jgi:hypothetical protein
MPPAADDRAVNHCAGAGYTMRRRRRVRVLLVDDHPGCRTELNRLIATEPDLVPVAAAERCAASLIRRTSARDGA